jgi:hypothetical protein
VDVLNPGLPVAIGHPRSLTPANVVLQERYPGPFEGPRQPTPACGIRTTCQTTRSGVESRR